MVAFCANLLAQLPDKDWRSVLFYLVPMLLILIKLGFMVHLQYINGLRVEALEQTLTLTALLTAIFKKNNVINWYGLIYTVY